MAVQVRQTTTFQRWVSELRDERALSRINARIRRLSLSNPGDTRSIGEGVTEMRVDHGPGYRIYFARRHADVVILLCGGDKSSQSRDIARAKQLAKEL